MQNPQSRVKNVPVFTSLWHLGALLVTSGIFANCSRSSPCENYHPNALLCVELTEMPVDLFNSSIKHIYIENSNIPILFNHDFSNCPSLEELIIEYSNVETIENDSFKELNSMKYLILKGNKIRTIHSVSLPDMLIYLDLSQNPLDFSGESPFPSYTKNLQTLYTSGVGMKEIVSAHLEGLESLVIWRIMENSLTYLKLEDFVTLKYISSIDVEFNNIENVVPLPAGEEINSVTFIDLAYNNLSSLDPSAFQGLPSLRELRLHDNPLVIPSNTPFLSHATIEIVVISRVNGNVLSTHTFKDLPQLISIEMMNSKVTNVTGAFVDLHQLRIIYLQNNLVEVVEAGTFAEDLNLKRILLSGNPLREFDTAALVNVTDNGVIEISNTPLACSLECYDLEKWAPDNGVQLQADCSDKPTTCNSVDICLEGEHCCQDQKCSKQGVCCSSGPSVSSCFTVFLSLVTVSSLFKSVF